MSASERIKERMKIMGLSQNALAKRAGMSQSGLSTIMSGKAKPREDSMEAIAAALGCTVADLYDEAPQENAPDKPGLNEFLLQYLSGLTPEKERMVLDFLQLSEEQMRSVRDYVEFLKASKRG